MKFYFDESGNFRLHDDGIARTGIVAGVTIPESAETDVFAKFDAFLASLCPTAFNKKGEPKGSLLKGDERARFARMVAAEERIVVSPAILDITSISKSKKDVRASMAAKLRSLAEQCIHQQLRDETHLIASQFKNLSDNQALRMGTIVYCIKRAFEQTVILMGGREYDDCWRDFRFEIDPADVRPDGREQVVFKWIMLGWLQGWSQKSPTMLITEVHTKDHPLIKNFSNENDKFDYGKIYKDNIHYPDSAASKGLQIADMATTIINRAVNGVTDTHSLTDYGYLLKNNLYSSTHVHGLFTLADPGTIDLGRYRGLCAAVAKVKGERPSLRRKRVRL
jgi:hypothetical protein